MRYKDRMEFAKKYPGMQKKKFVRNMQPRLTIEEREMVRCMLLGPFKEEWFNSDGIVDNTDSTIAKRLDLPYSLVALHTCRILKDKEYDRILMKEFLECKACNISVRTCKKHKTILNKLLTQ